MLVVKSARLEDLDLGVAELDHEHQVQIAMIVTLEEAISQDREPDVAANILDRLTNYTKVHFLAEQLLMQWYKYPHYDVHTQEHDDFLNRLQALQKDHRSNNRVLTHRVVVDLKNWMLAHCQGPDQGLADHLTQCGIGTQGRRRPSLTLL